MNSPRYCAECGVLIEHPTSPRVKYCSRLCSNRHFRKVRGKEYYAARMREYYARKRAERQAQAGREAAHNDQ
ncbi:MAG: hypothetical protein ACP5VE_07810 [Chthonomonadales bacterium]